MTALAIVLGLIFASRGVADAAAPAFQEKTHNKTKAGAVFPSAERERQLESFEVVWQTIRDKHWDPKLGGLDWQKVHDEFRPRLEKAESAAQARSVIQEMIGKLGQSHFEIIPEAAYREIDKASEANGKPKSGAAPAPGMPGFEVRLVDGEVLVTKVEPGSAAAKLGVHAGWQVRKVSGQEIGKALAAVRQERKSSHMLEYYLQAVVGAKLRGKFGDKLPVVFVDGQGMERELAIPLAEPAGIPARFGNLPTFFVSHESRMLPGNIAYFHFSAFFDPVHVIKALEDFIKANPQADGFILDLRGNPGGIGAMAMGVGGWFVSQPNQKLGSLHTRDAALHFVLNPRIGAFKGPLAILVDGLSASTSEILAGGLQGLKRARVFGGRTAGAALPAQIVRLPSGDGFLFAFANYLSVDGQALEGKGVVPDVAAPPSRQALLQGDDPAMKAASTWIESVKKSKTTDE